MKHIQWSFDFMSVIDSFSTFEDDWFNEKFPDWENTLDVFKADFLDDFYWIELLAEEEFSLEHSDWLFENLGIGESEWEGFDLHTAHDCEKEHPHCSHREWADE